MRDIAAALAEQAGIITGELALRLVAALLAAFLIIVIFNVIQLAIGRVLRGKPGAQKALGLRKAIKYAGFVIAVLSLFGSMGVDTTALLGAAGVIGIAVGFAAQTSVSSLISGFFLLSEKPFQVGDAIRVDDIVGEVLSVDILSVKLRTFDNLFVRIPNETLFKSSLFNLTRFPIRRLDILLSVSYNEDLERLRDILLDIARANDAVLESPAPNFRVDELNRAGALVNLTIWFERSDILLARTSMYMTIQKRLAEEGIAISYQKIEVVGDALASER